MSQQFDVVHQIYKTSEEFQNYYNYDALKAIEYNIYEVQLTWDRAINLSIYTSLVTSDPLHKSSWQYRLMAETT